tara:strand:- start:59 stop:328 length:270 start_codon:yes stop_codon:yes gene_type:complete
VVAKLSAEKFVPPSILNTHPTRALSGISTTVDEPVCQYALEPTVMTLVLPEVDVSVQVAPSQRSPVSLPNETSAKSPLNNAFAIAIERN